MADGSKVFVRYEPNHSSFRQHMLSSDVLEAAMKAGRDVVLAALVIAPESEASEKGDGDGTRYRERFEVVPDVVTINDGGFSNPRASAVVVNDAKYAAQVEFGIGPGWSGSRPQGGHHGVPGKVLARAGEKVGRYINGPTHGGT